jgi:hypothetical protein
MAGPVLIIILQYTINLNVLSFLKRLQIAYNFIRTFLIERLICERNLANLMAFLIYKYLVIYDNLLNQFQGIHGDI